jgi:hypothetical protein
MLPGGVRSHTMPKKKRSLFWVVSTHVLTTGFAMPAIAGMVAAPIASTYPSAIGGLLLALGFQTLGYVGGVYYSLSYLRKVTLIECPLACVKPSIVTFIVLAVLGFVINAELLFHGERAKELNVAVGIVALVVFYIVITFAFARITQRGFQEIERQMAPQRSGDGAR